jgi:hypothetical protein
MIGSPAAERAEAAISISATVSTEGHYRLYPDQQRVVRMTRGERDALLAFLASL